MRLSAALLVALIHAFPVLAQTMELEGEVIQGSLIIGRTQPGTRVEVDGRPVRVSEGGLFLIGLGRDAGPKLEVRVGSGEPTILMIEKRQYEIQRIDGLAERKVTPGPEDLSRIRADNARIGEARSKDTADPWFASGFSWPLRGRVSGVYGSRRILNSKPKNPHNGVDIAAPEGTPIKAPADGLVVLAVEDMFYTGKTMMIDHGHGLTSVFAHMSEITVNEGRPVAKGEVIGKVGMSGRATGPHLHWGVSLFKTHLDPALIAGEMEKGE